jgi:hypothetical protein
LPSRCHHRAGAGAYSINASAHVNNWAGIHHREISHVARAGIWLAIGVGAGLLTVIGAWVARSARTDTSVPAAG